MRINNEFKEVLNSRMFQNSRGKIFDNPSTILNKSLELLDNYVIEDNYRLKTSVGSINRNEDGSPNIAYDKFIVEFKIDTYSNNESYSNICIVYDLTRKNPLFKVAAGKTLVTCLNMCIVADTDLYVTDDYNKISDRIKTYVNMLDNLEKQYETFRDKLENEKLNKLSLYNKIGNIIYNSKGLLQRATVEAIEDLQDSKSNYYIEHDNTTSWNLYNAITQQLSNKLAKGFADVPTETLTLSKLI